MSCAEKMSTNQWLELSDQIMGLPAKGVVAWIAAMQYLDRWGSIPSDIAAVCGIFVVTPRYLRERIWPLVGDRLTLSEDGRRYMRHDLMVERRSENATPTPQNNALKSERHQRAANIRHGNVHLIGGNPKEVPPGPPVHPVASSAHATGASGDAKTHAKSMGDASGFASGSASGDATDASGDATGASDASRAPSLSLPTASLSETLKKAGPSEGERESAPANARAGADATVDATVDATDASGDAKPHATADAKPHASGPAKSRSGRPIKTYLPPEWEPRADIAAAIEAAGLDVRAIAMMFRAHHTASATEWADWDAGFALWWARERKPGLNREMPWMQPVSGGKANADPSKTAADEAIERASCEGTGPDPAFARAMRSMRQEVGDVEARTWLRQMTLRDIKGDEATVYLPSLFQRDFVKDKYGDRLTSAFRREHPAVKRIAFEVALDVKEARHQA